MRPESKRSNPARTSLTSHVKVAGGAYTDVRDLIRLRYAAQEINAIAPGRTRNPLSGMLTSNFRGRGIDFAEVRVYQPGDDVRTIDWRVTARTQTPHTKLFQEEKERPVLILVDQSHAMFFGSRVAFKSVIAAEAGALLAWAALDRGDRTGGIVFSATSHRDVRPRRSKHSVLRFINELNDFNHALKRGAPTVDEAQPHYLANALRNVRRVARHGSSIFIISDFSDFNETAALHLSQLSRHNDIVGIHVSDKLEQELPKPDLYMITDGEHRTRIDTTDRSYRKEYHSTFEQRLEHTRSSFARIKAPLIAIMTHEPLVATLAARYNAFVAQQR
ncbi:MAG: DUF58 domain-containing protein [Pseudomonadales bacterium]